MKTHYESKTSAELLPGCGWGGNAYIQILENKTKGKITGPTVGAYSCNVATAAAGSPLPKTRAKCWWNVGTAAASGHLKCNTWYW